MLLILTNKNDRTPDHVLPSLEALGVSWIRLDTDRFPQQLQLGLQFSSGAPAHFLRDVTSGHRWSLDDVQTVWYRRPVPVVPDPSLSTEDQTFVRRESQHALNGLLHCLGNRFWVKNPYDAGRAAEYKPHQLQIARAVGLDTPTTIITNDPNEAGRFCERFPGQVVYKTLTPHTRPVGDVGHGIFTNRLSSDNCRDALQSVSYAPCIFQEHIPKAYELRVTVIGKELFVTRIDSQTSPETQDDWRRGVLTGNVRRRRWTLEPHVANGLGSLVTALGLVVGCIDLVVTPTGRVVFLEINPNGQWLWADTEPDRPLVAAFSHLLAAGPVESANNRL